jgi:flagellar hook-associated protein 3 FlgL
MTTRVTDKMVYSQAGNAINRTRGNLVKNQEQGTSGKRISRPSDDPAGLVRSLDLKQQLAQNKQLQTNVVSTNAIMKISENALGDLSDVLARAKELAVSMSNTTNQEKSVLQSASAEVEQLFSRASLAA